MTNQTTLTSPSNSHRKAGSTSSKTMSCKAPAQASSSERKDVCQIVTDSIIKALEAGTKPWARSWSDGHSGAVAATPLRHNGDRYRGINVLILWGAQTANGYASPFWMTYRQADEMGAQVRKGEKGTLVVYYGRAAKDDDAVSQTDETGGKFYRFLKTFCVFSADQIEGLPDRFYIKAAAPYPSADRIPELDALVRATGAVIHHGGNRAYYRPGTDAVQMPDFDAFRSPEFYYATMFHELAHWTKHPTRLNREFGSTMWGDEGYAKEELVAELAAAFIGAEFGFGPEHLEDHASYIATWLTSLKEDKRMIFMAAAKAQEAADYITGSSKPEQLAEAA